MCLASALFGDLPKVAVGETAVVANSGGNRIFALPSPGRRGIKEFCCITSGSTVLLRDVPQRLQERLGIGSEVMAVMTSPDADRLHLDVNRDDEFQVVGTGKKFYLHELDFGMKLGVVAAVDGQIDREFRRIVAETPAVKVPDAAPSREREMALTS